MNFNTEGCAIDTTFFALFLERNSTITQFSISKPNMFELNRNEHSLNKSLLTFALDSNGNQIGFKMPFPYNNVKILIDENLDNQTIKVE